MKKICIMLTVVLSGGAFVYAKDIVAASGSIIIIQKPVGGRALTAEDLARIQRTPRPTETIMVRPAPGVGNNEKVLVPKEIKTQPIVVPVEQTQKEEGFFARVIEFFRNLFRNLFTKSTTLQ